ncbi:hypothetical protein B9479_007668 [Cryptococcus floricola]|uniref:Uncharacterized protein n=1 Tax=Cryptococcus floricola TaxID=2591691 RepID=A0A5D3ALT1_9TREE|nr:hypothetical protein B9479_007668 [Cryptococcus floricola]
MSTHPIPPTYEPRRFILETVNKPRSGLWGQLISKDHSPSISYRYIPGNRAEPLYFLEFRSPMAWESPIPRLHLCKAWAIATNGAILMRWIKANCAFAATGPYFSLYQYMYGYILRFQCYQQELGLAMEMLVDWEAAHHVPRTWKAIGDVTTNTLNNRYRLKPSSATSPSRYPNDPSPLFIYTVQDLFEFVSYLRTKPLTEMLGDVVPDCEYYVFPPNFPIKDSETRLLNIEDE